jgi:hypothetical protein
MSADSPAVILFDESGNPIGNISDGYANRLQTEIVITDGYNGVVAVKPGFTPATLADTALVVAISPNSPITTTMARPSLGTTSSVQASVSSVSLLPANSIRLGATIYNDSSGFLFVKLGAGASTGDFNIKLFPFGYYEVPFSYTGQIDGVWNTNIGFARIGELI